MTDDPLELFHEWIDGNEMVLATATPDGRPFRADAAAEIGRRARVHVLLELRVEEGTRARGEPAGGAALPHARTAR